MCLVRSTFHSNLYALSVRLTLPGSVNALMRILPIPTLGIAVQTGDAEVRYASTWSSHWRSVFGTWVPRTERGPQKLRHWTTVFMSS